MSFDTLITLGIVLAAAIYLYRKFTGAKQTGGCGCASGCGGCGAKEAVGRGHSCQTGH